MDVNVFKLGMKLVVLLSNNADSLLVVTPDSRCTIESKINAGEEAQLLLHLRGSKGE